MELTKEHFDQVISGLVTKKELDQILDKKISGLATQDSISGLATQDSISGLATKDDLKVGLKEQAQLFDQKLEKQTKEIKKFAEDQTEELARIIANSVVEPMQEGFKSLNKNFDNLKPRVEKLEKDMTKLKSALQLG